MGSLEELSLVCLFTACLTQALAPALPSGSLPAASFCDLQIHTLAPQGRVSEYGTR